MGFKSCLFHFNLENYGASERYYYTLPDADLSAVASAAEDLLKRRVKFLATGTHIAHAYVSDDDFYRDSLPVTRPAYPQGGQWNKDFLDNGNPDIRTTSLLVRSWSNNRGTKQNYHACVPDFSITAPTTRPQVNMGAEFLASVDTFYKHMRDNNWGWKGIGGPTTNVPVDITDIVLTVPQPGMEVHVSALPAGLKAGDYVRISGVKYNGLPNPNGIWKVSGTLSNVIKIIDYESVDFTYVGGGKASARAFALFPITNWQISGATSRRRGPGFTKPVGRSKRRT